MNLGYISPLPLLETPAGRVMDQRALESLAAMSRLWPGTTTVAVPEVVKAAAAPPGCVPVDSFEGDLSFAVIDQSDAGVDSLGLDISLALLAPHSDFVTRAKTPTVVTAEVTYPIRLGIQRTRAQVRALPRIAAGLMRVEAGLIGQARRAVSVQANGPAATSWYRHVSRDVLTYHDSRIHATEVASARMMAPWRAEGPLRLGFSGRLDPIKGPQYALAAARACRRAGLDVEMHVLGVGPMEEALRSEFSGDAVFHGFQDFHTQWVPFVSENVDLMLLPHVQGDPSCTYFESLGAGAPFLAFANETATPVARRHQVGWTVRRGDIEAMVAVIRSILEAPHALGRMRVAGLDLMTKHSFEATTERRVAHLMEQA